MSLPPAKAIAVNATATAPIHAKETKEVERRGVDTRQWVAGGEVVCEGSGTVDVEVDDDLIETDFGAWEGLTFREAAEQDPDTHSRWLGDTSVPPPGGESFADLCARLAPALAEALAVARDLMLAEETGARLHLRCVTTAAAFALIRAAKARGVRVTCGTTPAHLLLSDIVMPEMDGIELARRATELDPDIKVMFITGFAAVALNPDSQTPKDAKVLSKPFHLRELVNEVEKLLAA